MHNPTRRSRNIGTSKQGHGQKNKLVLPYAWHTSKYFYEQLKSYKKVIKTIHGEQFTFIVEKTKKGYCHACTIDDLVYLIQNLSEIHFKDLRTIILRQPKKKEEILESVWGRLIYVYDFEEKSMPAIILEAQNFTKSKYYPKSQTPAWMKEIERLKKDGHAFIEIKKKLWIKDFNLENVRNTQLYRTFLHELGHYIQYTSMDNEIYFQLPEMEQEAFAHQYADELKKMLEIKNMIPFSRILDEIAIKVDKLDVEDFML